MRFPRVALCSDLTAHPTRVRPARAARTGKARTFTSSPYGSSAAARLPSRSVSPLAPGAPDPQTCKRRCLSSVRAALPRACAPGPASGSGSAVRAGVTTRPRIPDHHANKCFQQTRQALWYEVRASARC